MLAFLALPLFTVTPTLARILLSPLFHLLTLLVGEHRFHVLAATAVATDLTHLGKLVISYNSLEELDGILEHIN